LSNGRSEIGQNRARGRTAAGAATVNEELTCEFRMQEDAILLIADLCQGMRQGDEAGEDPGLNPVPITAGDGQKPHHSSRRFRLPDIGEGDLPDSLVGDLQRLD
jgi:hypothetical protein